MKRFRLLLVVLISITLLSLLAWQGFLLWQSHSIKNELASRQTSMQRFFFNAIEKGKVPYDAYIAHGGGINEFHYTNSLEGALDALQQGLRFIELDLRISKDGHIVAVHDWSDMKQMAGLTDSSDEPLTLDACNKLRLNGNLHILTAETICRLLQQHADIILVTDKIRDYDLLLKEIPFPDRMIVEIFHLDEYRKALKSGIRYPAFQVSSREELKTARKLSMPVITLNAAKLLSKKADIEAIRAAHADGVTIMAYSAADTEQELAEFMKKHLGLSISKVYSDFPPSCLSASD